jgi:hypothetical protein
MNELIRFVKVSATIITGSRWEWGAMNNNRIKSKLPGDCSGGMADLDELSRARATLARLADINARCSADVEKVLRQAQELRRQLLDEARISNNDANF